MKSPFFNLLKTINKLGECDLDTLQKYSGIEKETLKKMLILGLTGTNEDNSLIVMDSDFKNISLMTFGEDVINIPIEAVIKVYDKELGLEVDFKTAKQIDVKSNVEGAEVSFLDDKQTINPALSYINETVYLTQKLPVNMIQNLKGVKQTITVEMPVIIHSNGTKRGVITIDKLAMENLEVDGLKLKSIPLNVKNRWSIPSIKGFLEDTIEAENNSLNEVFTAIRGKYEEYMEFKEKWHYDLISMWCMGTYFHQIFNSYPYIFLNAVKRSGKTKCLNLTGCMSFNSLNALTMTPSSLFRIVDSTKATLLIDEMENLNRKDTSDMRTLLLAGYKKGAEVPRVEEKKSTSGLKSYGVPTFEVYSPKIMANISGIEDVLEDRCVSIILNRGTDKQKMNREVDIEESYWQNIRDMCYNCLMLNSKLVAQRNKEIVKYIDDFYDNHKKEIDEEIREDKEEAKKKNTQTKLGETKEKVIKTENKVDIKDVIDSVIKGRGFELWRPMFTIASLLDKHMLKNILINAVKHEKLRREEDITETLDSILVELLLELVEGENYYRVKDIANKLKETNPDDEKWLTTRWVGRALKRLGLVIEKKRHTSGVMIKISESEVKKIAEKLGISVVEPVNILEKEKRLNQNTIILDTIDEMCVDGEVDEHVLTEELKKRGVTNTWQKLELMKSMGLIYNPHPKTVARP